MPPCELNPHCNNKHCPAKQKIVKQGAEIPINKRIVQGKNPDSILQDKPSWVFNRIDADGEWKLTGNDLWNTVLPKLKSFESQRWGEVVSPQKHNHFIEVSELNKCARDRLDELKIYEDEILSLRLDATTRLYGLRPASTFIILWYDKNHGDSNTCVCRSHKKHT